MNAAKPAIFDLRLDRDGIKDQGRANKEIVILDVVEMSSSSESGILIFCPICETVFENRNEIIANMYKPCNLPNLDNPSNDLLCPTCTTVFETEKAMDYHEPCPKTPKTNIIGNTIVERLNKTRTKGACGANILNPPRASGSAEGATLKKKATMRRAAPKRPNSTFTSA